MTIETKTAEPAAHSEGPGGGRGRRRGGQIRAGALRHRPAGQDQARPDAALYRDLCRARQEHRRRAAPGDRRSRAASSAAARSSTSCSTTNPIRPRAPTTPTSWLSGDKVDFLIGTVHSGVAMAMVKVARDTDTMLVIPNAGVGAATGAAVRAQHLPHLVLQLAAGLRHGQGGGGSGAQEARGGDLAGTMPRARNRPTASPKASPSGGGKVEQGAVPAFPQVEFQPLLTEIAAIKPDVVYAFFAGGGAVKFVKDYAAAGLRKTIPLVGPGFLTDGTLRPRARRPRAWRPRCTMPTASTLPKDKSLPRGLQEGDRPRRRRLCGAGLRHRRSCWSPGLAAVKGDVKARARRWSPRWRRR